MRSERVGEKECVSERHRTHDRELGAEESGRGLERLKTRLCSPLSLASEREDSVTNRVRSERASESGCKWERACEKERG